jgi:hypothetical protein
MVKTTKKGYEKRMLIWQHNALGGAAAMTAVNMRRITDSSTATPAARAIAQQILDLCPSLIAELKTRNDK